MKLKNHADVDFESTDLKRPFFSFYTKPVIIIIFSLHSIYRPKQNIVQNNCFLSNKSFFCDTIRKPIIFDYQYVNFKDIKTVNI